MDKNKAKQLVADTCGFTIASLYPTKPQCSIRNSPFGLSVLEGKVCFYVWSSASPTDASSVMGPWLQAQLETASIKDGKVTRTHQSEREEGNVAQFDIEVNWENEENFTEQEKTNLRDKFNKISDFFSKSKYWPDTENDRKNDIQLWNGNEKNIDKVNEYIKNKSKQIDQSTNIEDNTMAPSTTTEMTIDMRVLKDLKDIKPETHAGCYELVQKAIDLYKGLDHCKPADLDMINYFTQVERQFKTLETKIDDSSLKGESAKVLKDALKEVENKYKRGGYDNNDSGVGIVGSGGGTLWMHGKPTEKEVSELISKLVNIRSKVSLDEIYKEAETIGKIKGVDIGTVSVILHCLRPDVFPIWNGRSKYFFPLLPMDPKLDEDVDITNYIAATRRLNEFRMNNDIQFTNWRVVDILADNLGKISMLAPILTEALEKLKWENDRVSKTAFPPSFPSFFQERQKIWFGAPGTGKSYKVEALTSCLKDFGGYSFRTTFHPDYDYATFVGCYKPWPDGKKGKEITYKFVPQVFTKAYVAAWKSWMSKEPKPVALVIEEINRGNCAQIFGQIFQLLDRDKLGFSDYHVTMDEDLQLYLSVTEDVPYVKRGELVLPPNFFIFATMNTSDQSLFPMDSAFKRRWDWEYVPIDCSNGTENWKIKIGDNKYLWKEFLEAINIIILEKLKSPDKQLGERFVKADETGIIDRKTFVNKVMFYLVGDAFKDDSTIREIWSKGGGKKDGGTEIVFADFADKNTGPDHLENFFRGLLDVKTIGAGTPLPAVAPAND